MKRSEIAILFSGGADSTAAAVHYLQKGYHVHLLTFDNGAQRGFESPRERGIAIESKYAGRCRWKLLDCKPLFHSIAIKDLEGDVRRFGNLVCCGCKLAMLAEAILYCRRNGIAELADGYRAEQDYYPEQTPEFIGPAGAFAAEFGIEYHHPFYPPSTLSSKIGELSAVVTGTPKQARCLFGENPVQDKRFIGEYVEGKIPALRAYVKKKLSGD